MSIGLGRHRPGHAAVFERYTRRRVPPPRAFSRRAEEATDCQKRLPSRASHASAAVVGRVDVAVVLHHHQLGAVLIRWPPKASSPPLAGSLGPRLPAQGSQFPSDLFRGCRTNRCRQRAPYRHHRVAVARDGHRMQQLFTEVSLVPFAGLVVPCPDIALLSPSATTVLPVARGIHPSPGQALRVPGRCALPGPAAVALSGGWWIKPPLPLRTPRRVAPVGRHQRVAVGRDGHGQPPAIGCKARGLCRPGDATVDRD